MACEEAPPAKKAAAPPETEQEPEAPPPPPTPPTFSIDELGPKVRYSRSVITDEGGRPRVQGLEQLRKDLEAEKEHIAGHDILLTVGRKASPTWVTMYLAELEPLAPSGVRIGTETRDEYPKEGRVLAGSGNQQAGTLHLGGRHLGRPQHRSLEDRWRGQHGKRGRGMGGPDLTMTGETIVSLAKGCDSTLFIVSGAAGVEWGLIYDLAASAMTLEKAGLKRALLPKERPTAGAPSQVGRVTGRLSPSSARRPNTRRS